MSLAGARRLRHRIAAGAALAALAAPGCSRTSPTASPGPEPSASTGSSTPTTADPAGPEPTAQGCATETCGEAKAAAEEFIDLWWYGEPATPAALAAAATGLVTDGFADELAASEAVAINKLDPKVHVIVNVEAFEIDDGLVVVQFTHRDVGESTSDPALAFVDVAMVDGRWLVAATETR